MLEHPEQFADFIEPKTLPNDEDVDEKYNNKELEILSSKEPIKDDTSKKDISTTKNLN